MTKTNQTVSTEKTSSTIPRLDFNADTVEAAIQYMDTRARQMRHMGVTWDGKVAVVRPGVLRTEYEHKDKRYSSFYVLESSRGKGSMKELLLLEQLPILTIKDCNIESYLASVNPPAGYFVLPAPILESEEYRIVSAYYGSYVAKRSRAYLMNHIDEGLSIMAAVGSSEAEMRAFCIHPLLQGDYDLAASHQNGILSWLQARSPHAMEVLMLAMEYRNVANAYLAKVSMPVGGIRLSPLAGVNRMLIGDKVQNRKDFELYHRGTHPNSERLTEYFGEWSLALGVAELYSELIKFPPPQSFPILSFGNKERL